MSDPMPSSPFQKAIYNAPLKLMRKSSLKALFHSGIFALIVWFLTAPFFFLVSNILSAHFSDPDVASKMVQEIISEKRYLIEIDTEGLFFDRWGYFGIIYSHLLGITLGAWVVWNIIYNSVMSVPHSRTSPADDDHWENAFKGSVWGGFFGVVLFGLCLFSESPNLTIWMLFPSSVILGEAAYLLLGRKKTSLDMADGESFIAYVAIIFCVAAVLAFS